MSLIKSAWEIALEKTKDIQVDPKKIARDALVEAGRKLAAEFLSEPTETIDKVKQGLAAIPEESKKTFTEGILGVVLDNINLPRSKDYKAGFQRVQALASVLGKPQLDMALTQIGQFFDQYLMQEDQLADRLKMQYAPQLQAKQAQLSQQLGQDIQLQPEQDPDFLKLLDKTLGQLDAQYGQSLSDFKAKLKTL